MSKLLKKLKRKFLKKVKASIKYFISNALILIY